MSKRPVHGHTDPRTVPHTHVQVLQRRGFVFLVAGLQTIEYNAVRSFAIQPDLAVLPEHHGHASSGVVEVEDAKEFVDFYLAHHFDRYAVRCSFFEDDTEISGRRNESRLVGRLSLVFQDSCARNDTRTTNTKLSILFIIIFFFFFIKKSNRKTIFFLTF